MNIKYSIELDPNSMDFLIETLMAQRSITLTNRETLSAEGVNVEPLDVKVEMIDFFLEAIHGASPVEDDMSLAYH